MANFNRREFLKTLGLSAGAFVMGGAIIKENRVIADTTKNSGIRTYDPYQQGENGIFIPGEPLSPDEMRISFMGTSFLPRIGQAANSVFVETGNGDCFVFDCGSGVTAKYVAMGVPYSKMDKIFLTHLHADHMSDLMFIYCFGPSVDRKTDLHVWGPSGRIPEEGTREFCKLMYNITKWHRKSFSFLATGLKKGNQDAYHLIAHELNYKKVRVAYESNGVKITSFPAVHDRDGSISFKLEWEGLQMVFSGDTKPNNFMLQNAKGADVIIHETTLSPETWATKNSTFPVGSVPWQKAVEIAKSVQDSSHTPAKALGYILNETKPRLGVATHFQYNDDTTPEIMNGITQWYKGPLVLATDLMVLNVSKDKSIPIKIRMGEVSNYAWYPSEKLYTSDELAPPRYNSPLAQLSKYLLDNVIPEDVFNNPPIA